MSVKVSDLGFQAGRTNAVRVVELASIDTDHLIRLPRQARIMAVAASMTEDGLQLPVEVTPKGDRWSLTKGWVRVEAARFLGWTSIDTVVWRGSTAERAQRQIDDNLLQDGCTALDRARYLAAAKAAHELVNPETRNGAAAWKNQSLNSETLKAYWAVAQERYGFSRAAIFRALAVGCAIAPAAVALLSDTDWADNQSALEQIARFSPDQQAEIAGLITGEPPKTLADAISTVGGAAPADPLKKAWSAATGGWQRLGARERREWLREIATDLPAGVQIIFEDGR